VGHSSVDTVRVLRHVPTGHCQRSTVNRHSFIYSYRLVVDGELLVESAATKRHSRVQRRGELAKTPASQDRAVFRVDVGVPADLFPAHLHRPGIQLTRVAPLQMLLLPTGG
jgi:hypothetical protein